MNDTEHIQKRKKYRRRVSIASLRLLYIYLSPHLKVMRNLLNLVLW